MAQLWLLTIPWVMSQLSMGSRSESPPFPLCWAEDRKVPERKVMASPMIKKSDKEVIAHIVETGKSLFRLDCHIKKHDLIPPTPISAMSLLPAWKREEKFSSHESQQDYKYSCQLLLGTLKISVSPSAFLNDKNI